MYNDASDNATRAKNINIPLSNNHYGETYYTDFLASHSDFGFNSLPTVLTPSYDDDPMNDQNFLAFLSLVSPPVSMMTPPSPFNLMTPCSSSFTDSSMIPIAKTKTKRKTSSAQHTGSRLGQCEHPKHVLYRQEKYTLMPANSDETMVMKTIPRRGRPPKGSKSTEFVFSTSPIVDITPYYPVVELTVRPLPKRLEAVVGKSNIKVCLTCLKRSDTDPEYLSDVNYIKPQQLVKKK